MIFRGLVLSLLLLLLAVAPAGAVDVGSGTKNFSPPTSVPNYFSGEAGAVQGARPAPMPGTTYTQPAAQPRARVVMAAPRQMSHALVRGRDGRYRFISRGRGRGHVVIRGGSRGSVRAAHVQTRHASSRRVARR